MELNMDLPASLAPWMAILNLSGLGLLGWGMFYLYRTLLLRNASLEAHMAELKTGHDIVVATMKSRADELKQQFEDEKQWRDRYIRLLGDTETQESKLRALKDLEIEQLQHRLDEANAKRSAVEQQLEQAKREAWDARKAEAARLRLEVEKRSLETRLAALEAQGDRPFAGGLRGLR